MRSSAGDREQCLHSVTGTKTMRRRGVRNIDVSLPHTASPWDLQSRQDSHSEGRFKRCGTLKGGAAHLMRHNLPEQHSEAAHCQKWTSISGRIWGFRQGCFKSERSPWLRSACFIYQEVGSGDHLKMSALAVHLKPSNSSGAAKANVQPTPSGFIDCTESFFHTSVLCLRLNLCRTSMTLTTCDSIVSCSIRFLAHGQVWEHAWELTSVLMMRDMPTSLSLA